uniref:Secreted protein n=1 Tax=Trichogramma kaykai TaxID=54128 RepID=A0ABD2X3N3_9HYME
MRKKISKIALVVLSAIDCTHIVFFEMTGSWSSNRHFRSVFTNCWTFPSRPILTKYLEKISPVFSET